MTTDTDFHLETTAGDIRAALDIATRIIARRNALPILGAVLIADRRVTACSLDMEISAPFAAKTMRGQMVVTARNLAPVRLLPDDTHITLRGDGTSGQMVFPGGVYDLSLFSPAAFPRLDFEGYLESVATHDATALINALKHVAYAISTEEKRYFLNGVCLSRYHGTPVLVATTGYNLAWHQTGAPVSPMWDGAIIPHAAVKQAIALGACTRMVAGFAEDGASPMQRLRFEAAGVCLTTKLVNGTFPNWQRVVPACVGGAAKRVGNERDAWLALNVPATLRAISRMARTADTQSIACQVTPMPDGSTTLALRDAFLGTLMVEALPSVDAPAHLPLDERLSVPIGVNRVLLRQMLAHATRNNEVLVVRAQQPDSIAQADRLIAAADDCLLSGHVLMVKALPSVDAPARSGVA